MRRRQIHFDFAGDFIRGVVFGDDLHGQRGRSEVVVLHRAPRRALMATARPPPRPWG